MRAALLLAVLSLGCKPKAGPPPVAEDELVATPLVVSYAGVVVSGVFQDRDGRFSIAVPDGWSARPGRDDTALRVTLHHAQTGTRVRVWRYPGEALQPRPREGCTWAFQDTGPYRSLRVPGPVGVATCHPDQMDDARDFAWLHASEGTTWSVEVSPPSARLLAGLDAGEAVIGTARWRTAP